MPRKGESKSESHQCTGFWEDGTACGACLRCHETIEKALETIQKMMKKEKSVKDKAFSIWCPFCHATGMVGEKKCNCVNGKIQVVRVK